MDNQIQATYDRIYELEMMFKRGQGTKLTDKVEEAHEDQNIDLRKAKQKTEAMRTLYFDLEGQIKMLELEENTMIFEEEATATKKLEMEKANPTLIVNTLNAQENKRFQYMLQKLDENRKSRLAIRGIDNVNLK